MGYVQLDKYDCTMTLEDLAYFTVWDLGPVWQHFLISLFTWENENSLGVNFFFSTRTVFFLYKMNPNPFPFPFPTDIRTGP